MPSTTLPPSASRLYTPIFEAGSGCAVTVRICIPHAQTAEVHREEVGIPNPHTTTQPSPLPQLIAVKVFADEDDILTEALHTLTQIKTAQFTTMPSANTVRVLNISHVVNKYDHEEDDEGGPWYSMEAIRGCTLQRLRSVWQRSHPPAFPPWSPDFVPQTPFPLALTLHIALGLFAACEFLNRAGGFVVDDVHVDNVMLELPAIPHNTAPSSSPSTDTTDTQHSRSAGRAASEIPALKFPTVKLIDIDDLDLNYISQSQHTDDPDTTSRPHPNALTTSLVNVFHFIGTELLLGRQGVATFSPNDAVPLEARELQRLREFLELAVGGEELREEVLGHLGFAGLEERYGKVLGKVVEGCAGDVLGEVDEIVREAVEVGDGRVRDELNALGGLGGL
ncbi:hypothetical protein CC80DRAFT_590079 [Byssothecium circinans]|uniref:Protein kinase domain-containing protein n=1 Tax=Byssothecium circinans TaxID=147558 RepID=A0A6A5U780_9PLEO|nr:hypothetical protein CC80DRAFT_590079 [Byssothecium circinans]